jgi:hypothetical protein
VDEPHDAVKLLLARMESHPEEFRFKESGYHDRWYNHISSINSYGNEADKAALAEKTRDIRMAEVHEQIMEELCNGPENRRKEEEEAEYERKLVILAAQKAHQKQIMQKTQNAMQQIDTSVFSQANQAAGELSSSINQLKQVLGVKK